MLTKVLKKLKLYSTNSKWHIQNIQRLTWNEIFFIISWKSLFRSFTWDWPAAKWAQIKQKDVAWNKKRIATAPLLPVAPPNPVLTESMATSLKSAIKIVTMIQNGMLKENVEEGRVCGLRPFSIYHKWALKFNQN